MARPVRVAVTVEQFWEKVPGGTATAVSRFLRAHRELTDRSELVGVSAAHRGPLPEQFDTGLRIHQLPLPRPALYDAWRLLHTPPVELATGGVDVIHATTFAVPPATKPLVVTIHDLAFLHGPEHFTPRGVTFFRAGLERTRRRAQRILVPSQHTYNECRAAGLEAERLRIVPWGVKPIQVDPDLVIDVRRKHGLERDYVLWCGTAEPRKNLAGLLAAFASVAPTLGDVDLALVGPAGWGDALGSGRRPSPERVHTLGYVADAELSALYAGARAFCYPSLREGFGLPVLEAMAAGTPVVTSTGTPMAHLVGNAGVAVNPTDVAELANALVSVAGNDHARYAANTRARADEFSWQATASATEAVYREVA